MLLESLVVVAGDLRRGVVLAWLVASALLAPVLAAPFLLPERSVLALAGACRSSRHGERLCPLCGMTRAFLRAARGDWRAAAETNRAGPLLFAGLAGNEAAALLAILQRRRRQRRIIMVDKSGD